MNFYKQWKNLSGKPKETNGIKTKIAATNISSTPSQKQAKLYKDLKKFMEDHDIFMIHTMRPRTRQDYKSAIKGMLTVLGRNGLREEFLGKRDCDDSL